jgi:hypothetical protein
VQAEQQVLHHQVPQREPQVLLHQVPQREPQVPQPVWLRRLRKNPLRTTGQN